MLFNSYVFIFLFLPISLFGYFNINNLTFRKIWIILCSLYFYGYFNKIYILIILISIVFNYICSFYMDIYKNIVIKRKILLFIALIFNIGLLGYYKYFNFFIENINMLFGSNLFITKIVLPLGISFFTFQQISYVVDIYKEREKLPSMVDFAFFVSFFPQLIAGPIVLSKEMLPQIENEKNKIINYRHLMMGIYIFSIGLVKKVFLADTLANFSEAGFDIMMNLTTLEAWITSLSYTLQLYFDFSGYCDMAYGIAIMFNINLPINFNSPYKAKNISEFWQRWHITLGRFLKNYVYIPLGGNRKTEIVTLRNLFLVFLTSGIWHGAGWNFILWGVLHGIFIILDKIMEKYKIITSNHKYIYVLKTFFTFNIVNILWIFFRANNISQAFKIIKTMFNIKNIDLTLSTNFENASAGFFHMSMIIKILIFSLFVVFCSKNSFEKLKKIEFSHKMILETTIYLTLGILFLDKVSKFLYFNF